MQVNSIVQAVLFFCLMGCAAYTDIRKREIPPVICSAVAVISLLDFRMAHLFGILAAFPLLIIAVWIAPNRLGGGDIKLVATTGLVLGLQATNYGIIIGFTCQIVVFVIYAMIKNWRSQEARNISLPLAPCLAIGFLTIYLMKIGGIIHEFI